MRSTIRYINPIEAITDDIAVPLNHFRVFLDDVYRRGLLIGTGSPEGIVAAEQGREYMDEDGLPGAVKYIKQVNEIAGDRTQGWIAIG